MKYVLIACECSGVVREAFNAYAGIEAYSCDLKPCTDGRVDYHIQGDVFEAIDSQQWDAMIAHPPCTYINSAGLHWIPRGRIEKDGRPRRAHYVEALDFVRRLLSAPIKRIALENPAGAIGTQIQPASQWLQPYEFGDDASKKTGLWLKNLPTLARTHLVPPRAVCSLCGLCARNRSHAEDVQRERMFSHGCPKCQAPPQKIRPRWDNQTNGGQNKLPPSEDRGHLRSITYPGIAKAMAAQWVPEILR